MASNPEKDTIYIDVDEDITGIIDKVRGSDEHIVALVLPKRATVLQSIVNMKLLKRSADELKKKVVLITSEKSVLPLAGAVGLYAAKTLQSAPHIPDPPSTPSDNLETVESDDDAEDTPVDKTAPVGALAGLPDEEEIDVDDAEDEAVAGTSAKKRKKKNKKLKVPNFDSFRNRLFLVFGVLLAFIVLWVLAYKILPKAKITITTDSASVNTNLEFTADTAAKSVDEAQHILPATQKTYTKTETEKVAASGEKDNGTKATGSVTLTLKDCSQSQVTIPAGTGINAGGLTFITQQSTTLNSVTIGSQCRNSDFPSFSTAAVSVSAQQNGDKYNLAARSDYTVSGHANVTGSDSKGMSGGTSKVVKVVAQSDIDGAKQKILDRNNDLAKAELNKQLQADKSFGVAPSFNAGTPVIATTPNVGDEASEVTVNMTLNFTELGVKQDDLKKLVNAEAKKKIDQNKQTILSQGLDKAQTQITDKKSDTNMKVSLQTTVEAGPQLDADAIKKAIAGKKRGDTQSLIEARPGIKEVKIDYSPFYIGGTPTRSSRINVIFLQPNGQPSKQ